MRVITRGDGAVTGCVLEFSRTRGAKGCLLITEVSGPALRIGYGKTLEDGHTVATHDFHDVTDPADLRTIAAVIEGYLQRHDVPVGNNGPPAGGNDL